MAIDHIKVWKSLKGRKTDYDEDKHCPLILKVMINKGRYSAFCIQAMVCENTFLNWVKRHPLFAECYSMGKMFAREAWEDEGEALKDETNPPGVISNRFEYWKLMGWSRFGISKNSRIKLDLDPNANPSDHYKQLLVQASNGDFTSSEIKQLMESINVGLNTHQVFQLQKEIDELKSDLATMMINKNGNDTFAN